MPRLFNILLQIKLKSLKKLYLTTSFIEKPPLSVFNDEY